MNLKIFFTYTGIEIFEKESVISKNFFKSFKNPFKTKKK